MTNTHAAEPSTEREYAGMIGYMTAVVILDDFAAEHPWYTRPGDAALAETNTDGQGMSGNRWAVRHLGLIARDHGAARLEVSEPAPRPAAPESWVALSCAAASGRACTPTARDAVMARLARDPAALDRLAEMTLGRITQRDIDAYQRGLRTLRAERDALTDEA